MGQLLDGWITFGATHARVESSEPLRNRSRRFSDSGINRCAGQNSGHLSAHYFTCVIKILGFDIVADYTMDVVIIEAMA